MVGPFYKNIRLLILTLLMLFAWGFSAFQALPRQEDPEMVARTAVVQTAFPGANAERVEALVTAVIEEELSEIEEIDVLQSNSRVGFSTVAIELAETVKDTKSVWSKVRDELADALIRLPVGATPPELDEAETRAYTVIASLTWNLPDEPNYAILKRYAKELGIVLRGIKGTEKVEFYGSPEEEILVDMAASELAAVGLSPQQLAGQIRLSDAKVTAGQFRSANQNIAIEVENELETLEQIRQIPIQSDQGQFTRLSDIASVSRGVRDPLNHQALVGGKSAVVLGVMMQSGLRVDQWGAEVRKQLDGFRDRLPVGVSLDLLFNQSGYVEERIGTLIDNLLFGAALVMIVTFMGMGWRSALVVGIALPLSVFAVLGWMSVLNVPIHQMSVTGLIIALGLLIDNAIVVVDEIQVELQKGKPPLQAVSHTVKYLQVPLLASTVTTVITFLPIYLLPGSAGEFVGSIALSVILSLISSLVISLTVIAALAGRLLGSRGRDYDDQQNSNKGRLGSRFFQFLIKPGAWWNNGLNSPRLTRLYRWSIQRTTARPLLMATLTLIVPLLGFLVAGSLPEQFFPLLDRDQFQIEVEFAPQTAIAQTQKQVLRAREVILAHNNVKDVHWFVGQSAPMFYYNLISNRENQSHYAQAMVQLKSKDGVEALVRELQGDLSTVFPDARVIVQKLQQGPPFAAPVEMRIYGPSLTELRRLGTQVRQILTTISDVIAVRDDLTEGLPKLGLKVDEEQVQQAGLNNTAIAEQLAAYSEGIIGGSIVESTENLPVRVRLTNLDRASLESLASLDLRPEQSPDRDFRPTSALGQFKLLPESANVARRHEQRVNTVQAFITSGVLPSKVLAALQQRLAQANFQLPPGYFYEFGGEQAERNSTVGSLLFFVPLLVLTMITTLVLSLGSFGQTAIVAVVAIGSIGMALFSLKVFGSVLGFMAIVGSMGLVGIAINGSIMVLSAFNEDPQAKLGNRRSVENVVVKATRHVLTTTITTMVGFIPLLSDGDPFWQPLAIAIAGGIGGSPFLALYFTPAAYLLLKRRKSIPKGNLIEFKEPMDKNNVVAGKAFWADVENP
ncbi:putative RND efflux transporter [Nodularia sp. NIES-3585]|nr:putative RND efflux transporter [Nodularia sp. NIES-3585]